MLAFAGERIFDGETKRNEKQQNNHRTSEEANGIQCALRLTDDEGSGWRGCVSGPTKDLQGQEDSKCGTQLACEVNCAVIGALSSLAGL